MKTLLMTLQSNTDTIGLKYLHSYLCQKEIDSNILFIPKYDKQSPKIILNFINKFKPKVIGISLMSEEYHKSKDITQFIKKYFPNITIVWGGIHPTIDAKQCLQHADYVFLGESEDSFVEFIKNLEKGKSVKKVPNVAYKLNDEIIKNKPRDLEEDLDKFPFPEHHPKKSFVLDNKKIKKMTKNLFKKYTRYQGKFYSLTTTRGCPFSCAYCCNNEVSTRLYCKKMVRKRSVDNVIKELKMAVREFPDIIYINIQDDCFFIYDIEWMKEFAKKYKSEVGNQHFVCRSTPSHITEEKIKIMKSIGLSWIFMGLQSGSERINKEIFKRYVPNKKFIETTKIIKKYNVAGYYDIILDNPYENFKDLVETVKVVHQIPKPYMLQLFSLTFYPGTEIYDRAKKDKLQMEDPLLKNFQAFGPKYMNKVIRLCPLYSKSFIKFLIKNRKNWKGKTTMNIIYHPSIITIEPFILLHLTFKSFDYNIYKTTKMFMSFFKTAIGKTIFRRGV